MNQWIKCTDDAPPKDKSFLGYVLMGYPHPGPKDYRLRVMITCEWDGDRFVENCHCSGYERDREFMEITHWMSLPVPPEKD
jgi:hypothetical protein